jgi:hypothetical protein
VQVAELAPGLWRWTAGEVACFYAEGDHLTFLVDPVIPSGLDRDRFLRQLDADVERHDRPVVLLLTGSGHRPSVDELVRRYGARIWEGEELLDEVQRDPASGAVWLAAHRALAVGDAVTSVEGELRLFAAASARDSLRELLELPIEHVLVAHGDHVTGGRAALAKALER